MSQQLQHYVGRHVLLTSEKFDAIKSRANRKGQTLENRFVVGEVKPGARKLTCYGANYRVVVNAADVILL